MKKLLLILAMAFAVAGFAGAGYVLYTGGQASPGYGLIPLLFSLICQQGYICLKRKDK